MVASMWTALFAAIAASCANEVSSASASSHSQLHAGHQLAATALRQSSHAPTKEPPPLIDEFTIVYWSVVFVVMAAGITAVCLGRMCCLRRLMPTNTVQNENGEFVNEHELPKNMFSLTLVTAVDQATACGYNIPALLCWTVSVLMGCLQLFVIFLIVHDIDPNVKPVIHEPPPHTPWIKKDGLWTVHVMKWVMVTFLIFGMVAEVGQAKDLFELALTLNGSRMTEPRAFPLLAAITQYMVVLGIILGGVSAVMSLQDVPNIIYSSMSITFIGNIDEMFYEFFQQVFDIEADFVIRLYPKNPEAEAAMDQFDADSKKDILPHQLPDWVKVAMKILELMPMIWGFALIGRAWHTNIMPTDRLHSWLDWIVGL
eukprot:gnl/TRDRNA2_/TRDRNA2_84861_c0_seq1.p1 gnl/TRDRNA2_/TRDRNA2_84861_c0~~gnl/TRDRNA2_/TRDRNA2_84861_c0_seq1.p1  ORF type:complete len:371 (-),score=58.85 gnl/TRDRNA2_/TRDRNA2_84861_c0_seq1:67-1179(-)